MDRREFLKMGIGTAVASSALISACGGSRKRQADHCIGCGQCVPHCPQRIDIPRQMRRVDDFVQRLKQSLPA